MVCTHFLQAYYRWLRRWQREPIAAIPDKLHVKTIEQLIEAWQSILKELKTAMDTVYANDIEQSISFITSKGAKYVMPFGKQFTM